MRISIISAIAGLLLLINPIAGLTEEGAQPQDDWRENYAYNLGVAAMHYSYPYLRMAQVRWNWTMAKPQHPEVQPNHALNQFWHASRLTDADWVEGGAPNNDTLYSIAMLKVVDEPFILSVPEMDRYYTFQLAGMDSDNFGYVSELTHGRKGGHYALLPPGWEGELPEGVEPVAEVPSPWILIAGRTYTAGPQDLAAVRSLQRQYRLAPLSQWGNAEVGWPEAEVFEPFDPAVDKLAVWKTINRMLSENPPLGDEKALMQFFKEINIGPGLDVEALDETSQRGLARAAKEGLAQIKQLHMAGAGELVKRNGWVYSTALGSAGAQGDFMTRTLHQSYAGIVANDPEEAIYYGGYQGSDGKPLNGSKRYRMRFPVGSEPDVGAFWSITLYDDKANMVQNEIGRYSIGDRSTGLVRDAQGGLTIAIQADAPVDEQLNWLPAPKGPFWLVLRTYQPGPSVLNEEWSPPPVTPVE